MRHADGCVRVSPRRVSTGAAIASARLPSPKTPRTFKWIPPVARYDDTAVMISGGEQFPRRRCFTYEGARHGRA